MAILDSDLCPEAALLLCCARTTVDGKQAQQIEDFMHKGPDWTLLLRAARLNGVLPLLARHLSTLYPDKLPPTILSRLQQFRRKNLERNLFLTRELLTLLTQLEKKRIPAIPLKGPVLAALAYGDLAARQFRDLDILVQPPDVSAATQFLMDQGFQPLDEVPASQAQTFLRSYYHSRLQHPVRRTTIELHWGIAPRSFSLALEPHQLWQMCQPVRLASSVVQSLSLENLLLFLCIHGTRHSWNRLGWVCDVAELLRSQPQLDIDQTRQQAAQIGAERMLALGLRLAQDLLDTKLPATQSADATTQTLALQVRHSLLDELRVMAQDFSIFWFCVRARERVWDKIQYSIRLALTPTLPDWQWVALPTALSFLYMPLRPIRLTLKGIQYLSGTGRPPN